ncbi:AMP-binding protein, partial [Bordetella pertussis]|uniref:AMP-binding protein n=2 Tax=Bordetella pertussis TaxID=520 RepID=UPI0022228977
RAHHPAGATPTGQPRRAALSAPNVHGGNDIKAHMADFTLDDIKQRSMAEITAMQARRHGEKTFLHFLPRDERISYAGFDRRSSAVGRGLKAHGVQAGAHVGLILDNCPEMILAVFALAKIGAVWVPINTAAKGKLLVYYLDFADITTLIVHEKYLALIAACLHELPRLQRIVVVDDGRTCRAAGPPGHPLRRAGAGWPRGPGVRRRPLAAWRAAIHVGHDGAVQGRHVAAGGGECVGGAERHGPLGRP